MSTRHSIEVRAFGKTGMRVGVLGFGGGEIWFEKSSDNIVDRLLSIAADAGMNVIDTAAMYGPSEEKIGKSLVGRRDQFLLFTKCGWCPPPLASPVGFSMRAGRLVANAAGSRDKVALEWTPRVLTLNIEQSLRRLRTDRLDLIQLHSCSEEVLRQGDAIDALLRMREAGKVLHIGYSGEGAAASYALQCGQFESLQLSVNIADQHSLQAILPLAQEKRVGVIAKRPIANGLWDAPEEPTEPRFRTYWARLRKLQYDFSGSQRAYEAALRFTLSVAGVHTAIVGTANPAHLLQNIEYATAGVLPSADFHAICNRWNETAGADWVGQS